MLLYKPCHKNILKLVLYFSSYVSSSTPGKYLTKIPSLKYIVIRSFFRLLMLLLLIVYVLFSRNGFKFLTQYWRTLPLSTSMLKLLSNQLVQNVYFCRDIISLFLVLRFQYFAIVLVTYLTFYKFISHAHKLIHPNMAL